MTATLTPDNCFENAAFSAWWNAAEDAHEADYWASITFSIDDGGELDYLLYCYAEGMTPQAALKSLIDQWEPSDHQMMSAFGTKWHDGL